MAIALFIPCLTDQFEPRTGIAVARVLEHLGYEIDFPEAQTCCGQPMHNNGLLDEARVLIRRMVEVFEPYETVVTPSGSCAAMVRAHAPHLFDERDSTHAGAAALAGKTFEFLEFLDREGVDLASLGAEWPGRVVRHDACHGRGIGVHQAAERVLATIKGLQCTPLQSNEQCCGFGGTFSMKFPPVSGLLAADKVRDIQTANASAVACGDTGCAMHIEGACRRAACATPFTSGAVIVAEALGLMERADS